MWRSHKGGENIEVGREVFVWGKKKRMIRKKKNEKTCREKRPKKKWQNGGNLNTQRNFEWEKDKNFGETYWKHCYMYVFKMSLYVSPKFFGLYNGCSLITIATFSKNVAINKKNATKTVLFVVF